MHVIGQIRMQREIGCTLRLLFIVTLFLKRIQRGLTAKGGNLEAGIKINFNVQNEAIKFQFRSHDKDSNTGKQGYHAQDTFATQFKYFSVDCTFSEF